jgi:soluble lytic murein transglycosylase-like protein
VGQRYIDHLLTHDGIDGDLLRMATAYNAGPGNLAKWRRKMSDVDDPLLFIESLPSRQTRDFRLGQPLPTLDAVAAGDWPAYTPLDRPVQAAASGGAASYGAE